MQDLLLGAVQLTDQRPCRQLQVKIFGQQAVGFTLLPPTVEQRSEAPLMTEEQRLAHGETGRQQALLMDEMHPQRLHLTW